MKITFDGHWLGGFSGISTYSRRIFECLPGLLGPNEYSILTRSHQGAPNETTLPARNDYVWEQITLPLHLVRSKPDVVFFPDWRNGIIQTRPYVVTLHDLTFFTHPHLYSGTKRMRLLPLYRCWLDRVLFGACRILTVSEYSRKTILSFYPALESRVYVIYNGIDSHFSLPSTPTALEDFRRDRLGFNEPYLLNVGRIDYNKNLIFLCRVFLESEACRKHHLVLCGKRVNSHYDEVVSFLKEKDVDGRVHIISGIDHTELYLLYRAAAVFVMPSLSEGFGLPLLEAMAAGTPVLSADNTCLPEIMGNVDGLFDATNPSTLKARLELALWDTDYRKKLINAGTENIKRFSWERCAADTLDAIKSVP